MQSPIIHLWGLHRSPGDLTLVPPLSSAFAVSLSSSLNSHLLKTARVGSGWWWEGGRSSCRWGSSWTVLLPPHYSQRNTIASSIRINFSSKGSDFIHHPYGAENKDLPDSDDSGHWDGFPAFGCGHTDCRERLLVGHRGPQVFCWSLECPEGDGSEVQRPSGKWRRGNTKQWRGWKAEQRAKIITGMRESWQRVEMKVQVWPAGLIGITRQFINRRFLLELLFYFLACSRLRQLNVSGRFVAYLENSASFAFVHSFIWVADFAEHKHQECLLLHPSHPLDGGSETVSALLSHCPLNVKGMSAFTAPCLLSLWLLSDVARHWNEAGAPSLCRGVGKNSSTHQGQLLFQFYFNLPVYD